MKTPADKNCCRFRSHPWHGIDIGENAPEIVMTYVEMVPTDTVKYEMDKLSGYLRLDRPQRYSNVVPALVRLYPEDTHRPRRRCRDAWNVPARKE
ncbi:MAG: hypothetical protein MZV63_02655 [Marinilabiliales bacterium]|nr:hypothetical protein [Marinilabiliales bacterium]